MESFNTSTDIISQKRRKQVWTKEEDLMLTKLIKKYGPKKWAKIAQKIPQREGKQC